MKPKQRMILDGFLAKLFRSRTMGKSQSKISKEDMDFLQQKTDLDKSTIEVRLLVSFGFRPQKGEIKYYHKANQHETL